MSELVRQCGEAGSFVLPFFYFAENTEPPKVPTGPEFNRHWKVVERASGRYVDESGRRVAVRRRDDSETDVDDVHWAAHHLAKFWFNMSLVVSRDIMSHLSFAMLGGLRASTLWDRRFRVDNRVYDLAVEELEALRTEAAARATTIGYVPDCWPYYPSLPPDPSAIRLVELLPAGDVNEHVVCNFKDGSLSRIDEYEALSYVWEDQIRTESITVNGHEFQATENLEMALRHMRYHDRPRTLWIDAVCINQANIAERNDQVKIMGLIYRIARQVVVWLGPEKDASGEVFRFIREKRSFPGLDITGEEALKSFLATYRTPILGFVNLTERELFRRVWCIQEYALA